MLKVRALKKKSKHDEQEIGISKNDFKTTSDDDAKDDNSPEKERKPAKKKGAHHKTESNKGLGGDDRMATLFIQLQHHK